MKSSLDIAFITYEDLPAGDPDDRLALEHLLAAGYRAGFVDWRGDFEFASCPLLVLRSTWNYHKHFQAFSDWLKKVAAASVLANPLELVLWNLNKTYLRDLEEKGIAIVPTVFLDKSVGAEELLSICKFADGNLDGGSKGGSGKFVIKPTVGLATYGVKTFQSLGAADGELSLALEHIKAVCRESKAMLQPYMNSVEADGYGERALVFIDGEFSHAVRKSAFQHLAVAGHAGEVAVEAADAEVDFASRVLAALPQVPLYARVDVVRDESGALRLLELELVEPSLFLSLCGHGGARFAAAIEKRLSELRQKNSDS